MNMPLTAAQAMPIAATTTRPHSRWFEVHPSLGISMVDHLFNRLDGAYPHKWRSAFSTQQAIDNWSESWVEAFEDEGVTPGDIKAGLKACRSRYEWPPSCAEFIKACKPFADPTVAYQEAVAGLEARAKGEMGLWPHPAVYWAASLLSRELQGQTYAQVKDRWAAALKGQLARTEWAEVPPPRLQIEAPGKGALSKEGAAQMLRELDATGITKQFMDRTNHKAWAEKILARLRIGDKTLQMIQINLAKEAMGAGT